MDFTRMGQYLDSFYREKNIPGVGFAMYAGHRPVYEHYTGYSDVENQIPFGPDTLFNLYSATKLITCVSALQLLEQGKFRLTDPLRAYLPEYADQVVRTMGPDGKEALRPAARDITVEHLFSMGAGIKGDREAPAVQEVVRQTDGRAPTRDVVRAMAKEPLNFDPGEHFQYGVCHDVLGALVEAVSGERLGAYMRAHVLGPLGMEDTAFRPAPENAARMAKHYVKFSAETGKSEGVGNPFKLNPGTEYECGGGGLISSVRDYIVFAEMLCNGGVGPNGARILRAATIDDMRTNRLRGAALDDFAAFGGWSKAGYGYGLGVRTLMDRERNNSLSENGEFGWDGALGCYVVVDPKAKIAMFYAQQEAGSRWYEWHGTVRNTAYACAW